MVDIFETEGNPPIRWAKDESGKIWAYALTEASRPHQATADADLRRLCDGKQLGAIEESNGG